jgi:hypothetical protein
VKEWAFEDELFKERVRQIQIQKYQMQHVEDKPLIPRRLAHNPTGLQLEAL